MRGSAELPLFTSPTPPNVVAETLLAGDGDVRLWRSWLQHGRADALLTSIRTNTVWKQERRKMYDRYVDVPREQAWFGECRPATEPFTPELAALRSELEAFTGAHFAYVLLNRYRDGRDSVAWHHDREVDALAAPVIASLTLGATRAFDLRPQRGHGRRRIVSIDLDHGDLVVMGGETQRNYEHRVAKNARIAGERVNLTFRQPAGVQDVGPSPVRLIEQGFD